MNGGELVSAEVTRLGFLQRGQLQLALAAIQGLFRADVNRWVVRRQSLAHRLRAVFDANRTGSIDHHVATNLAQLGQLFVVLDQEALDQEG